MLYRKIEPKIREFLSSQSDRILLVEGARQVGKSFIIRHVGQELFENYIELNFAEDKSGDQIFANVKTTEEFYITVSAIAGHKMGNKENTLIFFDEIQEYPQYLTLLKFLRQEGRFSYIASGSLLGITLKRTVSIPVGSLKILRMYPLDFEEFLIANEVGRDVIDYLRKCFQEVTSPLPNIHNKILEIFKRYLIVGGMPDAVNEYLKSQNISLVRDIQEDIHMLYANDASKYDLEHKLKIIRIYNLLPSVLANKKKRLVFRDFEDVKGKRASDYEDEVDYLIDSGITLPVKAISNPKFPLAESEYKNLIKLYLNDVGILSALLFRTNITPILNNAESVNLGALYECAVAMELASLHNKLFYYDNKKYGEVDFLIDNYDSLSILPIEVKSGKDYYVHSSLNRFVSTPDYGVKKAIVLSNSGEIQQINGITYYPVYMSMYL